MLRTIFIINFIRHLFSPLFYFLFIFIYLYYIIIYFFKIFNKINHRLTLWFIYLINQSSIPVFAEVSQNKNGKASALVKKLIPKKNNAMVSTSQIWQ